MRRAAVAIAILMCGSLVYLVRSTDPRVFGWLPESLANSLSETREVLANAVHLPGWLRGSVSDAAYGFALGAWLADGSAFIVVLGAGVALAHEVAQGLGFAGGTFDVADLAALAGSYALGVLTVRAFASSLVSSKRKSS